MRSERPISLSHIQQPSKPSSRRKQCQIKKIATHNLTTRRNPLRNRNLETSRTSPSRRRTQAESQRARSRKKNNAIKRRKSRLRGQGTVRLASSRHPEQT